MALPFLPGNTFSKNLGKSKFHKSHHFDVLNDINLMSGATKPGIGGDRLPFQKDLPNHSVLPRGSGPPVPTWVAFDKQVLCFDAYYQEGVQERRDEQFRVHRCKIYFYLEDDSVQVVEPRMKNAGLPQGSIIRRHRINRPPPNDNTFFTIEDFDIGNELTMYCRKFKLVNCDEFTRNFMRKLGIKLRQPIEIPDDPYAEHRKVLDDTMQPLRPYEKRDTLKQFLDHDRHVLRFNCVWDDRDAPFGDPHEMVIHYYLADDTIEVREVIPANSGRDAVPMFLRRGKLPKTMEPMRKPGELADRTVLNVFGPMGHGGRYILDNLKTGAVNQEFYTDSDLTIGAYVNIWGRKFLICDCDEFTKEYYRAKYGINDFTPLRRIREEVLGVIHPTSAQGSRPAPPYNGFGGEEDSLNSTQGLLPRPPKRDFVKFMGKDRLGLDGNVLRFLARLDSAKPGDAERRFVISYFLADDTAVVFEPTVRNSGIPGGKFLERGKVKRPNQVEFSTQPPTYYTGGDFHVGARLEFNKHKFIIIDADDYAYNYMEQNCQQFPQSNIQLILAKLADAFRQLRPEELASRRHVPVDEFQNLLAMASEGRLTNQEIVTVSRFYQDRAGDQVELDALLGVAQEQLKRAGFEDFTSIIDNCLHFDRDRTGKLHPQRLRLIFRSVRVPIQDDILRAILSALAEGTEIAYGQVVKLINWRTYQVQTVKQTTTVYEDTWQGNQSSAQIQNVNMEALLQDLFGAKDR